MARAQARQEERSREKARKAEEDARIAEENRRAARYEGAGEAASINPTNPDVGEQSVAASITAEATNPHKNPMEPLGFQSITGSGNQPSASPAPAMARYSYDRDQGKIIKA
jgi:hypothetical protein